MTDLERFVAQEGREDLIADVRRRIDAEGITYIYYQFVSVTGRIMGKGVPAPHWETIARKGFQLVYGSTANLFIDRRGDYIGYGPEARELIGLPDVDTFCPLPWDPRVARVFCTLFRGREEEVDGGAFLTSDCPRQPASHPRRVHGRHRPRDAHRVRARDDVAQDRRRGQAHRRGHDQAVLLPHRPVLRAAAAHSQGPRIRGQDGARHDPGRS